MLLYIVYQMILSTQVVVWYLSMPDVTPEVSMTATIAFFSSAPPITGIVSIILGAALLARVHRRIIAGVAASLTLLALAVAVQLVTVAIGGVEHLRMLRDTPIVDIAQGLLQAWALICLPLFLGLMIAVVVEALGSRIARITNDGDQSSGFNSSDSRSRDMDEEPTSHGSSPQNGEQASDAPLGKDDETSKDSGQDPSQ
ncbi:hypothetical protein P2H44_09275 [Albimonas sp. CAU 1670]|uniref:hypothetical protein n=1 Tax=Albimonas sp. CAU 1670 TaxID=3032599 RepID=UPI0023DAA72B|nr:hypothetical protein [Albimonas sp. CAU 1670]MDF2232742.1 hypothetical protein [Albimonas sp. CAU 1670]